MKAKNKKLDAVKKFMDKASKKYAKTFSKLANE